ncbi:hypothetical protein EHO61_01985 [Leptospira fluminis]|uniref:Uncharacterized protein n=1 Tax=Leptospira fluminis TaxID=2484979 RepID=A0A4R9GR78_9LEPT|nr:hypothetical protein [Leptospira fluminis]TGK20676.1 hypothetical protein EHO61_01985 [Leptospira fluminis]
MVHRFFIAFIAFLFAGQAMHAAFQRYSYDFSVCTCNHGSASETHSSHEEDQLFAKKILESGTKGISSANNARNCHSKEAQESAPHKCSCKKHEKSSRTLTLAGPFLKGKPAFRIRPEFYAFESWPDSDSFLTVGHPHDILRPPSHL